MEKITDMPGVSIDAIRRGVEGRDAELLAGLYTSDARLEIVDQNNPPSRPLLVSGAEAIGAYYRDICGRNMEHRLENVVDAGDRIAFTQSCRYPDGTRVLCATVLEVRDGRIANQTVVQAWDA